MANTILYRSRWTEDSFEQACRDVATTIVTTVISKQHDYGHDNILAFREQGIVVRLWDKVSRLKNLIGSKGLPQNESIEDTFMDIAGYAIIGLMLANGTFTNELKELDEIDMSLEGSKKWNSVKGSEYSKTETV